MSENLEGVTKQTKTGTIEEFMGEKLNPPISYTYEFETYANKAAALSRNAWPSDADAFVLTSVNNKSEASAKSSAYQKALKDKREAYEKTPEFLRKQFIASAMAGGMSAEQAAAIADSIPGFKV